ncbi:RagB/SusD family nutrient uptake outer membrane protein [Mucilaginibacter boryungensis]|uniref:RagB/SusD family nutrient uptake outer membrane protein n=1 Tax=Mucilaginibacter boryungensis TaxID=768480 RepID=A0ABR9XDK9_9SPHI|nr:RagB/SusD family nutrient uptake outer membrane protein [Mucilaginibacter boryungensis]MBE9665487.1 RagB/SusD family nutrient uptake outer membrane protein [Mucilaginibacter boryungensis]
MKKLIFSIVFIAGILVFQSCSNDKINSIPADFATADQVAINSANVKAYINNLYTFVPRGYNRLDTDPNVDDIATGAVPGAPGKNALTAMVASATDEAVHATRNSAAEKWGTGQWSASSNNNWDTQIKIDYTGIRRTFSYTEDIAPKLPIGPGANEISTTLRDQYLGEALFIRALLNFELLKRYGGYPIVKTQLAADGNFNIPRNTYDECTKYISDLCDQAQALLPATYTTVATDFGRATKGACMALKARLLLYAASPLNNASNDITKWQAAAAAAAAIISTGTYSLYPAGTAGAGYESFFLTIAGNPEIIFSRLDPASSDIDQLNGLPSINLGYGGTCPTLDLVNDYETLDGKPFDWNNPAMAASPFTNRDPRFAKTILYNGAVWTGGTTVDTYEGGKDITGNPYPTRTGFYLRKFMGINARWIAPISNVNHSFPLFRYAEVLLNYAEAMNEAYGPDNASTFTLTARQAIALIRTRAGLTANQSVPLATTQALMRTAIRHERRIELAFEEHRHMDLRRWMTAETVLSQPVSGLKIVKTGTNTFTYTPQVVEQRVFTNKMYRYPFPQDELSRNPGLVQNPGW